MKNVKIRDLINIFGKLSKYQAEFDFGETNKLASDEEGALKRALNDPKYSSQAAEILRDKYKMSIEDIEKQIMKNVSEDIEKILKGK